MPSTCRQRRATHADGARCWLSGGLAAASTGGLCRGRAVLLQEQHPLGAWAGSAAAAPPEDQARWCGRRPWRQARDVWQETPHAVRCQAEQAGRVTTRQCRLRAPLPARALHRQLTRFTASAPGSDAFSGPVLGAFIVSTAAGRGASWQKQSAEESQQSAAAGLAEMATWPPGGEGPPPTQAGLAQTMCCMSPCRQALPRPTRRGRAHSRATRAATRRLAEKPRQP